MTAIKFSAADLYRDRAGVHLDLVVDNPGLAETFLSTWDPTKKYVAELKEYRERRSLDANAFCWLLIGKLADYYHVTPEEVYRQNIQRLGTYQVLPIREDAADHFRDIWESKGTGWIVQEMGKSKLPGYVNLRCWYGSSTYNSKEMSVLLDNIIDECKAAGIPTETPEEIARMKEEWNR